MCSLTAGKTLLLKAMRKARDCTGNCKEQRGEVFPDCIKVGRMGNMASEMGVALTWMAMPGMAWVLTVVQKSTVRSGQHWCLIL